MKTLSEKIIEFASPMPGWGIWVGEVEPDTTRYRIGQIQFENGGVVDDHVFLIACDDAADALLSFEYDEELNLPFELWEWMEDRGYFTNAQETLSLRGVYSLPGNPESPDYNAVVAPGELEDADYDDFTPEQIVENHVRALIRKTDEYEDEAIAFEEWKSNLPGQYEGTVLHVSRIMKDWHLSKVLTASEAAQKYGLSESTVRQAINRRQVFSRKSAGTHLILTEDAEQTWGRQK